MVTLLSFSILIYWMNLFIIHILCIWSVWTNSFHLYAQLEFSWETEIDLWIDFIQNSILLLGNRREKKQKLKWLRWAFFNIQFLRRASEKRLRGGFSTGHSGIGIRTRREWILHAERFPRKKVGLLPGIRCKKSLWKIFLLWACMDRSHYITIMFF